MPKAKLTKQYVESIARPERGVIKHWDTDIKGFGLFAQKSALTWYMQWDAKGKTQRVLIGRYPTVNTTRAREAAEELAYRTRRGVAKHLVHDEVTLREAMEAYLNKDLSAEHRRIVRYQCEKLLRSWLTLPLSDISRAMVRRRHTDLVEVGVTTANSTLRNFRAIWNHARHDHEGLPECPTVAIEWLEERPTRNGVITDLPAWRQAVEAIDNPIHRAAYLLGLFTGMRLGEVLTLEWPRVRDDHLYLPADMNKSRRDFWLPIVEAHLGILEPMRGLDDRWCFPAPKARDGHVVALTRVPPWTFHSLRHTFASVGVELGFLEETVGRLLNHATGKFTSRYVKVQIDALRPIMQSITAELTRRLNAQ